jgi:hypothetical protein
MNHDPKTTPALRCGLLFAAVATLITIMASGARADETVYNSFGPGLTITPTTNSTGSYTLGPAGTSNYMGANFPRAQRLM